MVVRLVAAIVALSVILPSLIFGGTAAVDLLAAVVALVCVYEYRSMALPGESLGGSVVLLLGTVMVYGCGAYAQTFLTACIGIVGVLVMAYTTIWLDSDLKDGPAKAGKIFLGVMWIGALLPSVPLLRRMDNGLGWLALVLVVVWASDTGAYFAGRSFGKKKLYERVSPNKSWEGVYGGVLAAVLGVFAMNSFVLQALNVVECVLIGVVLSAVGILGDLAESLIKRTYGVKDSGKIMPGHGGLLDRIDSLLFVAPALYGYLIIVGG